MTFNFYNIYGMNLTKEKPSKVRKLYNRFRLIIIDDHTYEELLAFKLTKLRVYVVSCLIFVVLLGINTSLFVFTPLKYYIPGFGSESERKELTKLKLRVDSLEKQILFRETYWNNVRNILQGNSKLNMDTSVISIPDLEEVKY